MMGKLPGPSKVGGSGPAGVLGIFPVAQYLDDPALRQAVAEIVRNAADIEKATEVPSLRQFHPLSVEEVRKAAELDAYSLASLYGILVRADIVVASGSASRTRRPPGCR